MPGFRGPQGGSKYAGIAGADLENAPAGPVPFTSPFGLPITRLRTWFAGGTLPGTGMGVPGNPVQRVAGNPGVATTASQVTQNPYGGSQVGAVVNQRASKVPSGPGPGPAGGGDGGDPNNVQQGGLPQFGLGRALNIMQESAYRGPAGGAGTENNKLVTRDRHMIAKVGYENSGRDSGYTDPPVQGGPARPSYQMVNRTINYQKGTDNTLTQDDLSRDYSRAQMVDMGAQSIGWVRDPNIGPISGVMGREGSPYIGEQGVGWSPVYGGVPGLYQPYGSYGGVTSGPIKGIQSPVAQGAQGDGPRKVWSGPPHGLHTPTLPSYSQTIGRYMDIPQQRAPRVDRPSNSPIAGQSYSQTVQNQGDTGTTPQNTKLNSGVAFNQRTQGNGWRGRAAG
jgi:hypothetical protein